MIFIRFGFAFIRNPFLIASSLDNRVETPRYIFEMEKKKNNENGGYTNKTQKTFPKSKSTSKSGKFLSSYEVIFFNHLSP